MLATRLPAADEAFGLSSTAKDEKSYLFVTKAQRKTGFREQYPSDGTSCDLCVTNRKGHNYL